METVPVISNKNSQVNTMPPTTTIAGYLFTRLKQLAVFNVFGIPGDYRVSLLDCVEPASLSWIGNTNELNAGHAADEYARLKGVGVLITTLGFSEMSATNAIAGTYAERAAVVHIVGTPARMYQREKRIIHHTLGDGDFRHLSEIHEHVTVAQTDLAVPETAAEQIDHVLTCSIRSSFSTTRTRSIWKLQ